MLQSLSLRSVFLTAFVLGGLATLATAADTGTIKGSITATGVRSPEDVVVYLEKVPGDFKAPSKPVAMDQKKLVFLPHVLVVVKGTSVEFRNGDPILHNVFWSASDDGAIAANNLGTWGQGDAKTITFDKEGHIVLLCNIHAEMEGHILVLSNPFFAVAKADGDYEIKNVPAGTYTVKTWYPQPKKLKAKSADVTVEAGKDVTQDFSLSKK